MMALDINTIFYEYNYVYRRVTQKNPKKYEVWGHRVSSITAARSSLQLKCFGWYIYILKSPLNCCVLIMNNIQKKLFAKYKLLQI